VKNTTIAVKYNKNTPRYTFFINISSKV